MRISEMKKQALEALKGKWGFVVLGTFVFFFRVPVTVTTRILSRFVEY